MDFPKCLWSGAALPPIHRSIHSHLPFSVDKLLFFCAALSSFSSSHCNIAGGERQIPHTGHPFSFGRQPLFPGESKALWISGHPCGQSGPFFLSIHRTMHRLSPRFFPIPWEKSHLSPLSTPLLLLRLLFLIDLQHVGCKQTLGSDLHFSMR